MKMASARRSRSAYSFFYFAQNSHAQARSGKGMTVNHVMWQSKGLPQLADLVLEEFAQGLEQLQAELFRQATDVVMAFDGDGFFSGRLSI